jgi:hypothetical protein
MQTFKTGEKVKGLYHDVTYSGTITESRVDTARFQYLYTVELDAPITLYSTERTRLHFSADDFVTVGAA